MAVNFYEAPPCHSFSDPCDPAAVCAGQLSDLYILFNIITAGRWPFEPAFVWAPFRPTDVQNAKN